MASILGGPTFENILGIMSKPQFCVEDVVSADNIKQAIKFQNPRIIEYLKNHINEVADIALGSHVATCTKKLMESGTNIITTALSLANHGCINTILEKLNELISNAENLTIERAESFSKILNFLIRSTNCAIFREFPESNLLLERLLSNSKFVPISNLIEFITNYNVHHMTLFLENIHASDLFVRGIRENPTDCNKYLRYLFNIISTVNIDSQLFEVFSQESTIELLFDIALHSENSKTSDLSFRIIGTVLNLLAYESVEDRDDNAIFSCIFPYTLRVLPELIQFITESPIFLKNKAQSVEILTALCIANYPVHDEVAEVIKYLFTQMRRQPHHTKIHIAFMNIFSYSQRNSHLMELLQELEMKNAVIEAYQAPFHVNRGFYHQLAANIIRIEKNHPIDESDEERENWANFIANVYEPIRISMDQKYGGPRPREAFESDPAEEEEEEEEEAIDEREAREAACALYGEAYVMGEDEFDFLDDEFEDDCDVSDEKDESDYDEEEEFDEAFDDNFY